MATQVDYAGFARDRWSQANQLAFLINAYNAWTVKASKIFKWYRDDFERGWGGYQTLTQFFSHYRTALELSDRDVQRLRSEVIDIKFLDYDWQLNRQ